MLLLSIISMAISISIAVASVVFIAFVAFEYGRFALSPWYIKDLITIRAIRKKSFKRPMQWYGYKKMDESKYGTLWEMSPSAYIRMRDLCSWTMNRFHVESKLRVVEVIDSTTHQRYILGIPAHIGIVTAKSAVAWTFGMTADQYNPIVET